MTRTLAIVISFLVGGAIGGIVGGVLGVGMGAGSGIAVALPAGICGVTKAAQDEGLLTSKQVDQVLNRAVANLQATVPDAEVSAKFSGASADCEKVLADLREAAKK